MKTNEAGLQIIRDSEGLRLKAYRCPAGVWTIGHGHAGRDVREGDVISEEHAEWLLLQDVRAAEQAVKRLVKVPLNANQFSALVSFVFNLGEGAVRGSTSLAVLNRGRYAEFADRMLRWNQGGGKVLLGLVRRREAERALFLSAEGL